MENGKVSSSRRILQNVPDFTGHFIFWLVLLTGTLLDLWSKSAIFDFLRSQRGGTFTLIEGFLRLISVYNRGAAFGIADGQRFFLTVISFIALAVIVGVFLFSGVQSRLQQIAFGLFAAGICGNLYDRIFIDGRVRDFVDIVYWPGKHWPAFNVADTMLCVAVGLIIISSFLHSQASDNPQSQGHRNPELRGSEQQNGG